jgi:hypothetical protein
LAELGRAHPQRPLHLAVVPEAGQRRLDLVVSCLALGPEVRLPLVAWSQGDELQAAFAVRRRAVHVHLRPWAAACLISRVQVLEPDPVEHSRHHRPELGFRRASELAVGRVLLVAG